MTFLTVTGFGNGNGRVITEDNHPIGKQIPVNVNESGTNPSNGCFDVGNGNGGNGCICDAVSNRSAKGLNSVGSHDLKGADHRLTGGECDGMRRKSTVESK